jgi:hypothetical protein
MTDPNTIRRGIERADVDLRSVAFHASVWEGREGWADHPVDARLRHGATALEELGAVIDTLGDLRIALRRALRAEASPADDDDQADEGAAPLVHSYAPPEYVLARRGGQSGTASMLRIDVTCPQCKILIIDTEA